MEINSFNENCTYAAKSGDSLLVKQHNKWLDKLKAKQQIKINNKYKIPRCDVNKDIKQIFTDTAGEKARIKFLTNKGKSKKYLGLVIK